jgi:hypothetical protein
MFAAVLLPTGSAVPSASRVEVGVVALAVALLAALVLVKVRRDHHQKIRKAAAVGYHDPDAARYRHRSVPTPAEAPVEPDPQPLAPTFTSPGRASGAGRVSRAAPSADVPTAPSRLLPAFDPVQAISDRPASPAGPPPTAMPAPPPPAAPSLPRLAQPPPPGAAGTDSGR